MAKMIPAFVGVALLVTVLSLVLAGGEAGVKHVDVEKARALIEGHEDDPAFVVLDVRTSGEVAAGAIEGSVNIDYRDESFSREISALDRGKTYLVYCRAGNRSARAAEMMATDGFSEVYTMEGGITAWTEAGYPVV
jgi:phage shock protein E